MKHWKLYKYANIVQESFAMTDKSYPPLAVIIYSCFTYPWRFMRVPSVIMLQQKKSWYILLLLLGQKHNAFDPPPNFRTAVNNIHLPYPPPLYMVNSSCTLPCQLYFLHFLHFSIFIYPLLFPECIRHDPPYNSPSRFGVH